MTGASSHGTIIQVVLQDQFERYMGGGLLGVQDWFGSDQEVGRYNRCVIQTANKGENYGRVSNYEI